MITISDSAVKKIKTIIAEEDPSLKLRVFVQGGGCSGFQYGFSLEELPPADEPQPQVAFTFGFLIVNDAPIISSLYEFWYQKSFYLHELWCY